VREYPPPEGGLSYDLWDEGRSETMKIAVTGGSGNIGRVTVAQLVAHGHQVSVLDRVAFDELEPEVQEELQGATYWQVDITDFDTLREPLNGVDAVVHLAAIPSPGMAPAHVIFDINCHGTFNVYQAAAQANVRRVVSASSINALGFHYGVKSFPIQYFPIDEAHPDFTTDPYSFSKQVLEDIAAYFWRREGISGVCLRFPAVYRLDPERRSYWQKVLARSREAFDALEAMPAVEREARIRSFIARHETMRAERIHERPWEEQRRRFERMWREEPPPPEVMVGRGWTNFWAVLHVLDAVQAIEKGLTVAYEGAHAVFVTDSHNVMGAPSEKLAAYYFPEVTERKRPLKGTESLVSIERARALLGFEPEHSVADLWRGEDPRME